MGDRFKTESVIGMGQNMQSKQLYFYLNKYSLDPFEAFATSVFVTDIILTMRHYVAPSNSTTFDCHQCQFFMFM